MSDANQADLGNNKPSTPPSTQTPAGPSPDADITPFVPEDLKNAGWLKNTPKVGGLVKSYDELLKVASGNIKAVTKDDSWETIQQKSESFYNLAKKEEEYKVDYDGDNKEDIRKLGFKYKMHPTQVKGFIKDFTEVQKNSRTIKNQVEQTGWVEKNKAAFKDISNKDELIGKALNHMGESQESLKEFLGRHSENPFVMKTLLSLGQRLSTVKDGKPVTSSDPSSTADISTMKEKEDFVRRYMRNSNSEYWNKSAPGHTDIKHKVDKAVKELAEHQQKTGAEIRLY